MPSTPYAIGSATSGAASNTLVITAGTIAAGGTGTGSGTTAGDAIVVGASVNSLSETVTGVTDSKGNTYVPVPNPCTASYDGRLFAALNTAALVSGTDTITVTYNLATANAKNAGAAGCSGILAAAAVDVNPVPAGNAGSATLALASGALAQASELLVSWADNASAGGAITWAGGFTGLLGAIKTASNQESAMAAQVVTSATGVTAGGTITSAKWAIQLVSLKISLPVVTTTTLPAGADGTAYTQALSVSGGLGAYTWSLAAGSLPAGLALSSGGVISGTPSGASASFTARVTDSNGNTDTQALTLTIAGGGLSSSILQPPAGYALFGAYPGGGNAPPAAYQAANMADRPLAVVARYEALDGTWPNAADTALVNGGQALCVDWSTRVSGGNATWAQVAAGNYDTQITATANTLAALGAPVFVGLNNEFDGGSVQGTAGPAANYVPYYRHIVNIVSPIAPNVIFLWVITGSNNNAATAAMYPGDSYVDWIGFDEYDATLSKGSPHAAYAPTIAWLAAQSFGAGKPRCVIETGVDTTPVNPDSAEAAWINAVPAALTALGIQLWVWFNSSGSLGNTVITPGSLSAAALAAIGASTMFNPPSVLPPSGSAYLAGGATSGAAANTLDIPVTETTTAGDGVAVFASVNSLAETVSSVADSGGNTYLKKVTQAAGYDGAAFVALSTAQLVAGTDTITVTYSSAAANAKNAAAAGLPGVLAAGATDATPAPSSATSAAPSLASGTLAQADEIILAWSDNASGGGNIAWGSALAPLTTGIETASNQISSLAAGLVSSTASVTAGGTLAAPAKWAMMLLTLKVGTSPVITTTSLPGGFTGTLYTQALSVSGGLAPYTWSISAGSLPAGMTLGASTGIISGTTAAAGTSPFTAEVTDSASNTGTQALSIAVTSSLTITTAALPGGTTGTAYSQALAAAAGTPPYAWSVTAGSLPAGLSLDAVTGEITGTPQTAGTSPFTVQAEDTASNTDTQALSIAVTSSLDVTTASLPGGVAGAPYSQALAAAGGYGAYTWSLASGSLPSPLALSSGGVISGTPAAAGVSSFTVQVTDAGGNTDTQLLSVVITSGAVPVGVTAHWSASFAVPAATTQPPPGTLGLPVPVANDGGNWLVAVIAWRMPAAGLAAGPTFSVADDAHNWWEPLHPGNSVSSVSGGTRCSAWIAPSARAASVVYAEPTGFSMAYALTVYEVTGMQPWVSANAVRNHANASASVTGTLPAPASQAIVFAVSGSDDLACDPIVLGTGDGWGAVTRVTASNGADHTADVCLASAWQVTSGAAVAAWSTTAGTVNFSMVTGSALTAAPALTPASPAWPVTILETSPGSGFQTDADQLTWTPLTAAYLSLGITQGRQYEASELSTGEGTLVLDNPAGALTPPGTGDFAGITAGTPVRLRTAWQGGSWQVQFSGNGTTAGPQASSGPVLSVAAGGDYSASAWLACSAPYPPGAAVLIAWYSGSGSPAGSPVSSAPVTGTVPELAVASGTAPAGAALAAVIFQAAGTPAASLVFYAAAVTP